MKRVKVLGLAVALSALVAGATMMIVHRSMHRELPLGDEPVVVEVEPGDSLIGIATALAQRGILEDPRLFVWYARLKGLSGRVQAGEYEVETGTTAAELLEQLVEGRVLLHSITIVEGWTFRDMVRAIQSHPAIEVELSGLDGRQIMLRLEEPDMHPEGLFYPDTYRFPKGTTDLGLLRQARVGMKQRLSEAWETRDQELPLEAPYDALILASIIEKETALEQERGKIAGVFVRRLQRGIRLQSDPTVIYGLGESFDGNIRSRDLRRDTPYNTYTRAGLPPTPIALASQASIQAALKPEDGEALYFVATGLGDGSHYFSATLQEHNKAVQRYLARLRERRAAETR